MLQIQKRREIAVRNADCSIERIEEINCILDDLRTGVSRLFGTINCDSSAIQGLLGSDEGVSNKNILKYMGIIEQKTMELLQMQQYIHMRVG